ncbi:uncharacterized protein LOC115878446 [Sitophilus oryzae]|uniref:Uncharacterized protein LOC115878446 n=1 Tax=Sitophilus oryzae TaxID=7048 RepID=A0A6J2XIS2_SITOR|nr:uncharacterized protein LOC115878446 [Sitophilus oryzae]
MSVYWEAQDVTWTFTRAVVCLQSRGRSPIHHPPPPPGALRMRVNQLRTSDLLACAVRAAAAVDGESAISLYFKSTWNNCLQIGKDRKLRIYGAIIKSNMLFGAETWRLMENKKRKLLAVERDAIRTSARTSRLDRVRNEIVSDKMGRQRTIVEEIESAQLKWYGH